MAQDERDIEASVCVWLMEPLTLPLSLGSNLLLKRRFHVPESNNLLNKDSEVAQRRRN